MDLDICREPKFIIGEASRFDLDQGALGDCWYVAAAATLATRPQLFDKVVPLDQYYDENYAGVFHFNFWNYGDWKEVIIDDRLPTNSNGELVFCSSREHPDEFWPGLLEKAYAKLAGSYEALDGGWVEDALVDFTGGIGQRIDLTKPKELPKNFYEFLLGQNRMNTLMGSSINATRSTVEMELDNGLFLGHAYSITSMAEFSLAGTSVRLLRLRNPWGRREWRGKWSDRSKEWLSIDASKRQQLGLVVEDDGEFWISYEDWLSNFQNLHLCHLPPNAETLHNHNPWMELVYNGSWMKGVNAGGSSQRRDSYWNNTQYLITLEGTCPFSSQKQQSKSQVKTSAVIISLMQKYSKRKKTQLRMQYTEVCLMLDLYKVDPSVKNLNVFSSNQLTFIARLGSQYQFYREISGSFSLEPGRYVIIPMTYEPNVESEYLLRVYTDSEPKGCEIDVKTERILKSAPPKTQLKEVFAKFSGADGVIDAREFQLLLNECFSAELNGNQFDLESCRSLISTVDKHHSGLLDFSETESIWKQVNIWKDLFKQFDKDNSGYMDTAELRSTFKSLGFNIGSSVLKSIVRRYGGKECKLSLNEFMIAISKIVTLFEIYPSLSKGGLDDPASVSLDSLLQLVMYV